MPVPCHRRGGGPLKVKVQPAFCSLPLREQTHVKKYGFYERLQVIIIKSNLMKELYVTLLFKIIEHLYRYWR